MYILPQCSSQSPASGDGNLIGTMVKMQDLTNQPALRRLARGTEKYFSVFVGDAGYQTLGNVTRTPDNFLDFRQMIKEEGGLFLGRQNG